MIKALSISSLNTMRFISALVIMNLLAFAKIPFPYVPLVLVNIGFIFWGVYFGKKMGALLALSFLLEGVFFHVPIFAYAQIGLGFFFSPTCGYVISYILAAYCAGWIFEKTHSLSWAFLTSFLLILCMGSLILSLWIGVKNAFWFGFVPFIIPDLIKSIIFMKLYQSIK
jgi:biotin transport system substrate-specific component